VPSQFDQPLAQLAMVQVEALQASLAFATLQTVPQAPQLFTLEVVFTSQPSDCVPLQSRKPVSQLPITHAPAEHASVEFGRLQSVGQVPQWLGSVCRFASQPFATVPSQLANPVLQLEMAQALATHDDVALARLQVLPQVPQFEVVVRRSVSQPFTALASQLPKFALQVMPHAPALQVGVPLVELQTVPHAPQFEVLILRSTSQPFE
jgi:hypothetical protein